MAKVLLIVWAFVPAAFLSHRNICLLQRRLQMDSYPFDHLCSSYYDNTNSNPHHASTWGFLQSQWFQRTRTKDFSWTNNPFMFLYPLLYYPSHASDFHVAESPVQVWGKKEEKMKKYHWPRGEMLTGQFLIEPVLGKLLRPYVFSSIWNTPAAIHQEQELTGKESDSLTSQNTGTIRPVTQRAERRGTAGGVGWLYLSLCPSSTAELFQSRSGQKLDERLWYTVSVGQGYNLMVEHPHTKPNQICHIRELFKSTFFPNVFSIFKDYLTEVPLC